MFECPAAVGVGDVGAQKEDGGGDDRDYDQGVREAGLRWGGAFGVEPGGQLRALGAQDGDNVRAQAAGDGNARGGGGKARRQRGDEGGEIRVQAG
ncbi:MAG: hypothetical protein LBS19_07490 [Clostridiales bacterium]|nr:hypothetical protein [Clostridiales bacterium]